MIELRTCLDGEEYRERATVKPLSDFALSLSRTIFVHLFRSGSRCDKLATLVIIQRLPRTLPTPAWWRQQEITTICERLEWLVARQGRTGGHGQQKGIVRRRGAEAGCLASC